jgi:hypothetical protein
MADGERIVVFVSGGVVQGVSFPAGCGVVVAVHDYDVDGAEDPGLDRDDQGQPFLEAIWEPGPEKAGGP